ncbi:glycosyl hydrolase family 18 protein [Lachnospiraceae bacterium 62-35]
MEIYVVQEGDNVDEIALNHNANVWRVIEDNQLEYPYRLAVGQALVIENEPIGVNRKQREKRQISSGGYAYPFINGQVLESTLPFLSELSVFSYGFTEEGALIPPMQDDRWMIEASRQFFTKPVLTLTPLGADGHFNNNLITRLINNRQVQERLIWNLGAEVTEKGYKGINVDFEYILPEDKNGFTFFVGRLTQVMNLFGYQVSVALAPKTSANQKGLLYEGVDYQGLGRAANEVFLMTYEWGYTYGPPMAVAPLNMVRRVVNYALTEIPAEKVILGIPNYGYDWPLPYQNGVTKAKTIGNIEAVKLAVGYGVPIQFDPVAQSPFFRYWQYGVQHEVWFEDARSIQAKLNLVLEYGLKGIGYWQLMRFFQVSWLLMENMFEVEKEKD